VPVRRVDENSSPGAQRTPNDYTNCDAEYYFRYKGDHMTKLVVTLLRSALVTTIVVSLWTAAHAKAAAVEYLMVPSVAMGRDVPIAFIGGGPHAVYLLDAFNAGDAVSNWVTAGNAMNTIAGKGVSAVAPADGAYSLYTDWEQDGSKRWETFLSDELPDWLAANKGLTPGGHAVVGASQGGSASLALAEFHPNRFRYAGSMSGFLYPSNTTVNGAITAGMMQWGGADTRNMLGPAPTGPVEVARPLRSRGLVGAKQHPDLGVQPGHAYVQRSRSDDRLLRSGSRYQSQVPGPLS
jgi:S-formylglutathione hydrolase FrmB